MENTYKKALFIYNPLSGNREISEELNEVVRRFMKHKILLTIIRLEDSVYDELGYILKNTEYDFVIGSGGDGTIVAIARNMINNNITKPYAVIGSGTCNNFASNINMSPALYRSNSKTKNISCRCGLFRKWWYVPIFISCRYFCRNII